MKVSELINELKKYDGDLPVGIGNVNDDSDMAIAPLEKAAIEKLEKFDPFENKGTGEYFVAIGYTCSVCELQDE